MKTMLSILAVLVCAVAFAGCGTDMVSAPETNDAAMMSPVVDQPSMLDTMIDSTTVTVDPQPENAPQSPPKDKKKPPPPPDPRPVEETTWGDLKARFR